MEFKMRRLIVIGLLMLSLLTASAYGFANAGNEARNQACVPGSTVVCPPGSTVVEPAGGGGGGGGGVSYGSIVGKVISTTKQPVEGATIVGMGSSVKSGSDGSFKLTMPVGDYKVGYEAQGYLSQTQWLHIDADQTTYAPTCVLTPTGSTQIAQENLGEIYGRVVDLSGQKIPGTAVRVNGTVIPTNPGGHFLFTLVHPGVYTVHYDAPGYIGQTQVIEVKIGTRALCPTVIMTPKQTASNVATGEVFGKVVDARGKMVPGTGVRIDSTLMPTNSNGEYRFTLVFPGSYDVFYDAPGYVGQNHRIIVEANKLTRVQTVTLGP